MKIVHIAVVNEPIEGRLGKWSAKPEPVQWLPVQNPDGSQGLNQFADTEKLPDSLTYDVSPGRRGRVRGSSLFSGISPGVPAPGPGDGGVKRRLTDWQTVATLIQGPRSFR